MGEYTVGMEEYTIGMEECTVGMREYTIGMREYTVGMGVLWWGIKKCTFRLLRLRRIFFQTIYDFNKQDHISQSTVIISSSIKFFLTFAK